jgi:hypothetical protein
MDRAQEIYKKYINNLRFIYLSLYLIFVVISAFLGSVLLSPLIIVLVIVTIFILHKLNIFKFRKHILSIILDDLDAPLYREVIKQSKNGSRNILWDIQSEFYVGNVRGAIDLCEASLKAGAIRKRDLRAALTFLAGWYFIGGDDEGVASVCRRYRELGAPKIKTKQTKLTAQIIAKYECYLAGDYDEFLRPIDKKRKGALYPIADSFEEALINMKKGDTASAKVLFSAVAVSAENTVFGMIAKRAIDEIDNGGRYENAALIEFEPIDTDAIVRNYIEASKKYKKRKRIILLIFCLALAYLLPSYVRDYISDVNMVTTHGVLNKVYGDAEILDIVSFKLSGEETEKIFIADIGDELIVGSKYWNDDGEVMIVKYVYPSFSELAKEGIVSYCFNPRGTSEFVYIKIYDYFEAFIEDDYLLCQSYYVNDHLITIVIDDKVIE